MNTQPEALRLADELGIPHQYDFHIVCEEAAAELRRLHRHELALGTYLEKTHELIMALEGFVECVKEEASGVTKKQASALRLVVSEISHHLYELREAIPCVHHDIKPLPPFLTDADILGIAQECELSYVQIDVFRAIERKVRQQMKERA